jgi:hypothetical protein
MMMEKQQIIMTVWKRASLNVKLQKGTKQTVTMRKNGTYALPAVTKENLVCLKYTQKVMNLRCNGVSVNSREDKSICIFVGPCCSSYRLLSSVYCFHIDVESIHCQWQQLGKPLL